MFTHWDTGHRVPTSTHSYVPAREYSVRTLCVPLQQQGVSDCKPDLFGYTGFSSMASVVNCAMTHFVLVHLCAMTHFVPLELIVPPLFLKFKFNGTGIFIFLCGFAGRRIGNNRYGKRIRSYPTPPTSGRFMGWNGISESPDL